MADGSVADVAGLQGTVSAEEWQARVELAALYRLVARHRHRLARGGQQCLVPSPDQRARFLT